MKRKTVKPESNEINTTELLLAMEEIEKTNGVKKEILQESIENALVSAYKKNYECNDENIKVSLDKADGKMHVYQLKEVVKEVENEKTQISSKDAKEISKTYKVGDTVQIELFPKEFGRIAAQSARQMITQKIREESREIIFDEFKDKKNELITGLVQKADGGAFIKSK